MSDHPRSWFDPNGLDPLVKPLVPLFTQLTGERLDGLRAALGQSDFEGMRRLAHTVKGSAASYGFAPIATAAAALEKALIAGAEAPELAKHLDELSGMQLTLKAAIDADPVAFQGMH